jgi:N-acyl-D-aspartate/D-glutamate deacylase
MVVISALLTGCATAPAFDLVLEGGLVLDGTGTAARRADVGIRGGRIAAIGELDAARAARRIDVGGHVVAPGFIDLHSHADLILLADRATQERLLGAKLAQGVTSLVVGNCGLGAAPATDEASRTLAGVNGWMTPEGVEAGPTSVADYLARIESGGLALNAGTLVPHGPVRVSVMGTRPGRPTAAELEAMRRTVDRGLSEGGLGLSAGLIYPPGMYSDTGELIALAEVVAARGKLFTCHVRGSSETLVQATRELIEIARASGARVHHSHLEAVGERFWPEIEHVLGLEDAARAEGLAVSHDVFPYTRAATMMSAIFPPWALEGGVEALLERLGDPSDRERLRREIAERVPSWPPWDRGGWPHNLVEAVGWDGIRVASVGESAPAGSADAVGRSLAELARESGRDPFDLVAELMRAHAGRVGQLVDEVSGRDGNLGPLLTILGHPSASIVSDAEDFGRGVPHPAHAGAFARALRLNREHRLLPLELLVQRMTGRAAALLGLGDRGVLRRGSWADVVVFDPEGVTDRASWDEPRLRAIGVDWVLVNGRVVVDSGRYLGGSPGAVLRVSR